MSLSTNTNNEADRIDIGGSPILAIDKDTQQHDEKNGNNYHSFTELCLLFIIGLSNVLVDISFVIADMVKFIKSRYQIAVDVIFYLGFGLYFFISSMSFIFFDGVRVYVPTNVDEDDNTNTNTSNNNGNSYSNNKYIIHIFNPYTPTTLTDLMDPLYFGTKPLKIKQY